MSSPSRCQFCGKEIVFRMIKGRCIPLHPDGGCPGHRDAIEGEEKQVDCLYSTDCPKCGSAVYFLRHNGGSTWLDSIPYPWPKHGCFLDQSDPVPESWRESATGSGEGVLVRLYFYLGNGHVTLTPVERKIRKWFHDLGSFMVIFEERRPSASIHGQLAVVTLANPHDRRNPEFRAVTLDGQRLQLVTHRPSP